MAAGMVIFMKPIDIVALVILAVGFALVLSSKVIANKFNLVEKQECKYASELSEEELSNYKLNKASFNVKITGLLITIPGFVLFLISNKF